MSKDINVAILYGYYGALLNEHQNELMRMYYDCDMSLSEISEVMGVSRQGVREVLARTANKLLFLEEKLGYVKLVSGLTSEIQDIYEEMPDSDAKERLGKLFEKLKEY